MLVEKITGRIIRHYDVVNKRPAICVNNVNQFGFEESDNGEFVDVYNKRRYKKTLYGTHCKVSKTDAALLTYLERHDSPTVLYLDIEVHSGIKSTGFPTPKTAVEAISLIQLLVDDKIVIIGDKEFYYSAEYLKMLDGRFTVKYVHCDNEAEMLTVFLKILHAVKPLVVYAWNGDGFDFPYIYKRLKANNIDVSNLCAMPDVLAKLRVYEPTTLKELDSVQYNASIIAEDIFYIDMLKLFKKTVLASRKSYALNNVAADVCNAKKLEHSEFKTFEDFYNGNYTKPENPTEEQRETLCYKLSEQNASIDDIRKAGYGQFVLYGIIDVILLHDIDKATNMTHLAKLVTAQTYSNFDSRLTTVKGWSNKLLKLYLDSGMCLSSISPDDSKCSSVLGGHVFNPKSEVRHAVLSFDVNSMYPNMIYAHNINPETFMQIDDVVRKFKDSKPDAVQALTEIYTRLGLYNYTQDVSVFLNADRQTLIQMGDVLRELNIAMSPHGMFFDITNDGIISSTVRELFNKRKTIKAELNTSVARLNELKNCKK